MLGYDMRLDLAPTDGSGVPRVGFAPSDDCALTGVQPDNSIAGAIRAWLAQPGATAGLVVGAAAVVTLIGVWRCCCSAAARGWKRLPLQQEQGAASDAAAGRGGGARGGGGVGGDDDVPVVILRASAATAAAAAVATAAAAAAAAAAASSRSAERPSPRPVVQLPTARRIGGRMAYAPVGGDDEEEAAAPLSTLGAGERSLVSRGDAEAAATEAAPLVAPAPPLPPASLHPSDVADNSADATAPLSRAASAGDRDHADHDGGGGDGSGR